MTRFSRGVIWFDRLLLIAATFIMTMIAVRNLRVGFGGFPLGFAIALVGCLIATRRLLTGVSLVAAVIGAATVARIQGLLVDGATSYNLALLRPEVVMLTLSLIAIVLERRRRRQGTARVQHAAERV
jgi:fucose permease